MVLRNLTCVINHVFESIMLHSDAAKISKQEKETRNFIVNSFFCKNIYYTPGSKVIDLSSNATQFVAHGAYFRAAYFTEHKNLLTKLLKTFIHCAKRSE